MLETIRRLLGIPRRSPDDAPAARWNKEKLLEVKTYLEGKQPAELKREDHYLIVEYLIQRYLPADCDITETQYRTRLAALNAKVDRNIDHPDDPLTPFKEDPEFAAWLKENLK